MSVSDLSSASYIDCSRILATMTDESIPVLSSEDHFVSLATSSALPDTQLLRMINVLEIEKFIPSRIAILLKLNWNDRSFASAILANIASNLHFDKHFISRDLRDSISQHIESNNLERALYMIYACMRYRQEVQVYSLDDIINFDECRLITFIQDQDSIQSKNYLRQKITELSEGYPRYKAELANLLRALNDNDQELFKSLYLRFLDAAASAHSAGVEKIAFQELASSLSTIPSYGFFTSLYRTLKTHEFYGEHLVHIVDLTRSVEAVEGQEERSALLDKCNEVYSESMRLLADYKNMSHGSLTLYCLQHGLVKQEWRKINKLFTDRIHLFCGCHSAQGQGDSPEALWPLNHKPFVKVRPEVARDQDMAESIAIMGCSWGSGHKQATLSIAEIMQSEGMHPVTIDVPDEMLTDPNRSTGGAPSSFSVQNVFNTLLQSKAYAVINFLRWASGMGGVYEIKEEEVKRALRRLLLINPTAVVDTIEAVSEPIIKASELLGIPHFHISTDVDRRCTVRRAPHDYKHFISCIPYDEQSMVPPESTTEKADQIQVTGPAVKRVYDVRRTPQQIKGLRQELQRDLKINLPENKKVVVISTGSNGSYSPYPELLAERYAGCSAEDIPFVCVVLCGNNAEYLNFVSRVSSRLPRGVIQPCRLVSPETVEKLYSVASYGGGVIAKGGGLTVYELSKCRARTLFDNMPSRPGVHMGILSNILSILNWILKKLGVPDILPWEEVNQGFAIKEGFGVSVSSAAEFYQEFDRMLLNNGPAELASNVRDFSERFPQVVAEAKQRAAGDEDVQRKRRYFLDPKSAANVIFK